MYKTTQTGFCSAVVIFAALFCTSTSDAQQAAENRVELEPVRQAIVQRMRLVTAAAGQFYAYNARYADNEAMLGLPDFASSPWIASAVLTAGSYDINLSVAAGGGTIRFAHQPQINEFMNYWTCQSTGRPDVALLLPGCRDDAPVFTPGYSDRAWVRALRREVRDELAPLSRAYQDNLLNYYFATLAWPSFVDLPFLQIQPMRWVQSAAINTAPDRGFQISLNAELGGGVVRYRLVEVTSGMQSNAYFECTSNRADISWILPGCRSDRIDTSALVEADPYWLYAKRAEIRDEQMLNRGATSSLLEFYLSRGRWPSSLLEGGAWSFLPRRWSASEQYQPAQYGVTLNPEAGAGSINYGYVDQQTLDFSTDWQCRSDRTDIHLIVPDCLANGASWIAIGPQDADLWIAYRQALSQRTRPVVNNVTIRINEFFASRGTLPNPSDAAALGLLPEFDLSQFAVLRVRLLPAGQFSIALTVSAGGGNVRFMPFVQDEQIIRWDCSSSDRADIASLLPGCTYVPTGAITR
jgi:hypothetical protein